jgi:predicted metalloprotease
MYKVFTLVVVGFVLAACEGAESPSAPGDISLDLYNAARDQAESFWQQVHLQEGLEYRPITVFTPYSESIAIPCGVTLLWDARYCPLNEGIYFHRDLLDKVRREAGDVAAILAVAHVVGHHVSNLRGLYIALAAELITIREMELQADCYSGAWAAWAVGGPLLEDRGVEGPVRALMALGDERTDLRWFNAVLHGTSEQRVNAFLLGRDGGNSACADIFQFRVR